MIIIESSVAVAVHLWNIPAHREAWKRVGQQEGGYGQLYQHFAHFLETDAIYLLNDAMEILPKGACSTFSRDACLDMHVCFVACTQNVTRSCVVSHSSSN
jgi:hypothetical protein